MQSGMIDFQCGGVFPAADPCLHHKASTSLAQCLAYLYSSRPGSILFALLTASAPAESDLLLLAFFSAVSPLPARSLHVRLRTPLLTMRLISTLSLCGGSLSPREQCVPCLSRSWLPCFRRGCAADLVQVLDDAPGYTTSTVARRGNALWVANYNSLETKHSRPFRKLYR